MITLYSPLLELKHQFFPPKLDAGTLLTAFLLWTFLTQFATSLICSLPKQSTPGAPSMLSTMRGCSTNEAELQKLLGVKNICLSSKDAVFCSEPGELVQGQVSRFAKGRATALQHRLLTLNSFSFTDSRLMPVATMTLSFTQQHAETHWAVVLGRSAL